MITCLTKAKITHGCLFKWRVELFRLISLFLSLSLFFLLFPSLFVSQITLAKLISWFLLIIGAPCQLHCKPQGHFFSVMLSDSVIDGTPCNPGTRDMCINGVCRVNTQFTWPWYLFSWFLFSVQNICFSLLVWSLLISFADFSSSTCSCINSIVWFQQNWIEVIDRSIWLDLCYEHSVDWLALLKFIWCFWY